MAGPAQPCRSRLAGDGDFTDAFAGKPAPTDCGMSGMAGSRKTCRSPACRRWRFHGRHRQQAGSYGFEGVFGIVGSRKTCRSPACRRWRFHGRHRQQAGSYKSRGCWGLRVHAKPVGAGLPAMAISRTPSPASRAPTDWGASPSIFSNRKPAIHRRSGRTAPGRMYRTGRSWGWVRSCRPPESPATLRQSQTLWRGSRSNL